MKTDLSKHVIYLRDELSLKWKEIGSNLQIDPDMARSAYRRAKGTHTPQQREATITATPEEFDTVNVSTGGNEFKVAFPTDEHFPYQDDRARSVALKIVSDFDPHLILSGSDGMDFYSVSRFNKDPKRATGHEFQREIKLWSSGQKEWRNAAPNAKAIFIPGNHEDRLTKWLWKHPALYGLEALEIKNLLKFNEVGISQSAYEVIVDGILSIRHGTSISKNSGMSAKTEIEKDGFTMSTMTGHSHRGGAYFKTTRNGLVGGYECFCLCDLNPEYIKNPNWQQGIVLATILGGYIDVDLIPIATLHGRRYTTWRNKSYWE